MKQPTRKKLYRIWYGWPLIIWKEFYKKLGKVLGYFGIRIPLIFAYCRRCGISVRDFSVSNDIWNEVTGNPNTVYCYNCFCRIGDKKGLWRRYQCTLL